MARGTDRAARAVNNPDLLVERTRRYGVRGLMELAQDIDADSAAVRSAPNPTMKRDDQKAQSDFNYAAIGSKPTFCCRGRPAEGSVSVALAVNCHEASKQRRRLSHVPHLSRSGARLKDLRIAVAELQSRQPLSFDLSKSPDYPTHLSLGPAKDLDALVASLGLDGPWGSWPELESSPTILAASSPRAKDRWIVVIEKDFTCQYGDRPRTRQATSVLGRAGSVEIVCALLSKALSTTSWTGGQIRRKDLAWFAAASRFGTATDEQARAFEKVLGRLDNGGFVTGDLVRPIVEPLGLRVEDLCFDHPAIYGTEAWYRRKSFKARRRRPVVAPTT